jgi:hypothetical protein
MRDAGVLPVNGNGSDGEREKNEAALADGGEGSVGTLTPATKKGKEEELAPFTQINEQWSTTYSQSAYGRLFLESVQLLSSGYPLHGILDPSGIPRPAHFDRS